jgi:hypothetical protein
MVKQPYFMTNKDWYTTNDNEELILTALAPKEAIDDYNRLKTEYHDKIKAMDKEEYIKFVMSEDSWLSFP